MTSEVASRRGSNSVHAGASWSSNALLDLIQRQLSNSNAVHFLNQITDMHHPAEISRQQYRIASNVAAFRAKPTLPTMQTRTGGPITWMTTPITTVSWIPSKAPAMTMAMDCQITLILIPALTRRSMMPTAMAFRMRSRDRLILTSTARRIILTQTGHESCV